MEFGMAQPGQFITLKRRTNELQMATTGASDGDPATQRTVSLQPHPMNGLQPTESFIAVLSTQRHLVLFTINQSHLRSTILNFSEEEFPILGIDDSVFKIFFGNAH